MASGTQGSRLMVDKKDDSPLDGSDDAGSEEQEPKRGGLSFPSAKGGSKKKADGKRVRPRTQRMGSIGGLVEAKAEEEAAKEKAARTEAAGKAAKVKADEGEPQAAESKGDAAPKKSLLSGLAAKAGADSKPFTKPLVGAERSPGDAVADSEAETVAVEPKKKPLAPSGSKKEGRGAGKPSSKPPVSKAAAAAKAEEASADDQSDEGDEADDDAVAALPVVDVGSSDDDGLPIDALPIVGIGTPAEDDEADSKPPDKSDDEFIDDGPSLGALMAEELEGHEVKAEAPIQAEPEDVPPLDEAEEEPAPPKGPVETGTSKTLVIVVAVVLVVAGGIGAFVLLGGDQGATGPVETTAATTATATAEPTAEATAEPSAEPEAEDAGADAADAAPSATASATAVLPSVRPPTWRPPRREDIYE